ncbi:hypothetical protein LOTGIDRAFT_229777 [Lottia gigantea]|uniref:Peptidase S1 domain-containing protein n=1 Tax=Lottia gigantea TaxID=225164 RepID=V3ZF51_LOTGI|nr:hypothetical protein LOTGIDRAFT_229777 [Lottia gigantea]ESO82742.1 hypothetical protein LOTGIDRAFT_229777 [Lottia gigantea]
MARFLGLSCEVFPETHGGHADVCDDVLKLQGGKCKSACGANEEEYPNYGYAACLGSPGYICCKPFETTTPMETTTPEPTTPTEPPTTTEGPTTTPQPAPPAEQCGVQQKMDGAFLTARILGGDKSKRCDWPWMVSIRGRVSTTSGLTANSADTMGLCNGVLINQDYVLTTADCVMFAHLPAGGTDPLKNIVVVAGETDIQNTDFGNDSKPTEQAFTLSEVKIHPDFFKSDPSQWLNTDLTADKAIREHDNFALLKLSQPAEFNTCIRQVCLPENPAPSSGQKENCKIAAWGNDQTSIAAELPGNLKEADVSISSQQAYNQAIDFFNLPNPKLAPLTTIAKFKTAGGSCLTIKQSVTNTKQFKHRQRDNLVVEAQAHSDSGGMLVCQNQENRWVLEGLINRPDFTECNPTETFIVSDVSQAQEWIKKEAV